MFTLGDVADILDSALDTGISIVDALAKLSEAADKGDLDRTQIFNDLNISQTLLHCTRLKMTDQSSSAGGTGC